MERDRWDGWDRLTFSVARETNWDDVASEMLCFLRADRSQQELARLLGYRSNVISNWEWARRFPTARQTLVICEKLGVDVVWALTELEPRCAWSLGGTTATALRLEAWLQALRGDLSLAALARTSGLSRHALGRWLRGAANPRLPQFLQVVEGTTGRAYELIRALVPGPAGAKAGSLKERREAIWRRLK